MSVEVQVRCPEGPKRLLMILKAQTPLRVTDGNLIEVACGDCKRLKRRDGDPVVRVLHRFNLAGDLVESVSEY